MKVYKNKYRYHWISPYTVCEKICFWREIDYDEPWVERTNAILAPICTVLMKFLDIVHPKIDYVKIDKWDTWSMDSTLSPIILPMLKQLKQDKHGSPNVDDADVPAELRSKPLPVPPSKLSKSSDVHKISEDLNFHKKWDWILDEMIWAFEQKIRGDWEGDYYKYEDDPDPKSTFGIKLVWEDREGRKAHQERMSNGFRLFGRYYEALWD